MGKLSKICLGFLLVLSLNAQAKNQCTEKNLVVDETQQKDFSGFAWTLPLPSYSSVNGKYDTGAVADFMWNSTNLYIKFRFDVPEDIVAKYYNIYRMEFDVGEGDDAFHYEVGDCTGAVGSFAPMDSLKVYPIEISRHADGSPRGIEPMHVKIWGRQ